MDQLLSTEISLRPNDMKCWYWKANGNISLLKIVYYTDSLYIVDGSNFKQMVFQGEKQIAEQDKIHRVAGGNKKKDVN